MYIVDEIWKNHPAGLIFKKMSPFKIPYDRAIVRLREAGLFNRIMRLYSSARLSTIVETQISVLKVEHYEGPIYLFVILNLLIVMVFLLEICVAWCKNGKSKTSLMQKSEIC